MATIRDKTDHWSSDHVGLRARLRSPALRQGELSSTAAMGRVRGQWPSLSRIVTMGHGDVFLRRPGAFVRVNAQVGERPLQHLVPACADAGDGGPDLDVGDQPDALELPSVRVADVVAAER